MKIGDLNEKVDFDPKVYEDLKIFQTSIMRLSDSPDVGRTMQEKGDGEKKGMERRMRRGMERGMERGWKEGIEI